VADRATIANMAPEYGATIGFFPVDAGTLDYLRTSNRDPHLIRTGRSVFEGADAVPHRRHAAIRCSPTSLELDLASVVPSMAGPKRPQDQADAARGEEELQATRSRTPTSKKSTIEIGHGEAAEIGSGAVVIAAITSCTNTSNPSVMMGAGLLAKKAVAKGLKSKPWVKTSLAPGSKVVFEYLTKAGSDAAARSAEFQPGGLRLHDLHRQQRSAAGAVSNAVKRTIWWWRRC
jgi:aconitate hydratase